VVVLGLIAGVTWAVRRFGADHLGTSGARGRQPRLAVIDAATVDNRRKLVLIRRDNVEHLLIIGGPTDVVVEQNIVRAASTARETTPARANAATDTLPRPVPLAEGTMWPLQPQPEPPPRPVRPVAEEGMQWPLPQPEPAPRPHQPPDPIAAFAEEALARPARTNAAPETVRMPQAAAIPAEPALTPAADQNLAEMAQRLEAALRRPIPKDQAAAGTKPAPAPEQPQTKRVEPQRAAEPRQAREAAPGQPKTLYDSLEQEMASLLGRPNKS